MNSAQTNMASISAAMRTAAGKGASRAIRASGQVPAVAYGREFPATSISVSPKDIISILKGEHGKNTVIKMALDAKDIVVMIRDFTVHPVNRTLEHVDFIEVKLDREVDTDIPLIVNGKAVGVTAGGIVRQVYRTLPVRSLPANIPLKIEVDITSLNLNEAIATKDLSLPEGVSVRLPAEQTLVAVVAPEKDRTEVAAPGAPVAAAPAGKAAAGKAAPAAAAAKPAAPAKKK